MSDQGEWGLTLNAAARAFFEQYTDLEGGGLKEGPVFPSGMDAQLVLDVGEILGLTSQRNRVTLVDAGGNPIGTADHGKVPHLLVDSSAAPSSDVNVVNEPQVRVCGPAGCTDTERVTEGGVTRYGLQVYDIDPGRQTMFAAVAKIAGNVATIAARGAAAANPAYVHVVNSTGGGGGWVPAAPPLKLEASGMALSGGASTLNGYVDKAFTAWPAGTTHYRVTPGQCAIGDSKRFSQGSKARAQVVVELRIGSQIQQFQVAYAVVGQSRPESAGLMSAASGPWLPVPALDRESVFRLDCEIDGASTNTKLSSGIFFAEAWVEFMKAAPSTPQIAALSDDAESPKGTAPPESTQKDPEPPPKEAA